MSRRRLLASVAATSVVTALSSSRVAAQVGGVPTVPPQLPPTFVNRAIAVNDNGSVLQRSFLVHLPLVLGPPMPAVIVFHGGGQNAGDMIQHWQSLIPTYDMVIVCPQGLVDPVDNKPHWYTARPGDVSVPTTDLAFVNALLDWLAAPGASTCNASTRPVFRTARRWCGSSRC